VGVKWATVGEESQEVGGPRETGKKRGKRGPRVRGLWHQSSQGERRRKGENENRGWGGGCGTTNPLSWKVTVSKARKILNGRTACQETVTNDCRGKKARQHQVTEGAFYSP